MDRLASFKNRGKTQDDSRRKRSEVSVELRKNKREDALLKRRNVTSTSAPEEAEDVIPISRYLVILKEERIPENCLKALKKINFILMKNECFAVQIINYNALPILIQFLKFYDNTRLQYEALSALNFVAAGATSETNSIVEAGAVPVLIELLSSPEQKVCDQAMWTLGNIVADGGSLGNFVVEQGLLPPLLDLLRSDTSIYRLRIVTWVINNVCSCKLTLSRNYTKIIFAVVNKAIYHSDKTVLIDMLSSLKWLVNQGGDCLEIILQCGIASRLNELLRHAHHKVQIEAITTMDTILDGIKYEIELDHVTLEYFHVLLSHPKKTLRRGAIWFLSNRIEANQCQVEDFLQAGLLPKIIGILCEEDFRSQKEAAQLITNLAISSNEEQIYELINEGAIPPFCKLLSIKDQTLITVVLLGLKYMLETASGNYLHIANIIEECQGLDQIEELQNNENNYIYELAHGIIEKYFSDDEHSNLQSTFQLNTNQTMSDGIYNF